MTSKKKANQPIQSKADKQPNPIVEATEQEPPEGDETVALIKPNKLKIGEGAGNLRQRQEWFQKRSGGK